MFLSQAFGFGERVIQLSLELSILASRISVMNELPMADAIIYATANKFQAKIITSDSHFANLDGVTLL
jgi:predicted nucleic acid-binding protein